VLFHPFFFLSESWNGIDEHLLLLSSHIDRERFEPLVLVHESDGTQTQTLAERARIEPLSAPCGLDAGPRSRLRGLQTLYARERIGLLHMHSPVAGGQSVPALAARLAGVKGTIATYHQIQPERLGGRSRVANRITHRRLVDSVMAVSHGVERSLRTNAGLAGPMQVVPNGVDDAGSDVAPSDLPARDDGDVWVGYFGRLSPEKGVTRLLEMAALLAPAHPQLRLLIVGDGPERDALSQAAAELGIVDTVHFLGFRSDARAVMCAVDIVVHAPVYEGFGLVVLEAMAAGRPVVASDAPGGVPDMVVDGETGVLVADGSPKGLASAIRRLLDDEGERRRLGSNGRRRFVEHFTAERMVHQVVSCYEQVLERRTGHVPAGGPARSTAER
jgi:glycosyltransferase involved in cell wall biosynthesis